MIIQAILTCWAVGGLIFYYWVYVHDRETRHQDDNLLTFLWVLLTWPVALMLFGIVKFVHFLESR